MKRGDAQAQYELGYCYCEGCGVGQDLKKAVEFFIQAALQGHDGACNYLGHCYANGLGVEKEPHKSAEWYSKTQV